MNFSSPPGARGIVSTFKLHNEDELPENKKKQLGNENLSKAAMKNKKRKEKKKETENETAGIVKPHT
jgi:hypothetical protein